MWKRLLQGSVPLTVTWVPDAGRPGRIDRGVGHRPADHHGRPRLAEAGEVCRVHPRSTPSQLAWMFTFIPEWAKTRRIVGWTTAMAMVVEIVIIDLQAWRGTTSHFKRRHHLRRRALDHHGADDRGADIEHRGRGDCRLAVTGSPIARWDGRFAWA
jgi:hypothetical protein